MTTQVESDVKNRAAARRFFWVLLMLATGTSLYGNIAHAIRGSAAVNLNSIVCASIAPVFLMALVHGAAYLARNTGSGWAYWVVVASIGVVATLAFAQSFGALTAFARDVHVLAPYLTPLIVDATIGVSTFALVVLEEKPTARARAARAATADSMKPQAKAVAPLANLTSNRKPDHATATVPGNVGRGSVQRRSASAVAGKGESATSLSAPRPAVAGDATFDLAAQLVRDGDTRLSVEVVRGIIEAHNNGDPLNRIANSAGRHHSTVKRVIDAAAAHVDRQLGAAG